MIYGAGWNNRLRGRSRWRTYLNQTQTRIWVGRALKSLMPPKEELCLSSCRFRRKYANKFMVACDSCDKWYHSECVGQPQNFLETQVILNCQYEVLNYCGIRFFTARCNRNVEVSLLILCCCLRRMTGYVLCASGKRYIWRLHRWCHSILHRLCEAASTSPIKIVCAMPLKFVTHAGKKQLCIKMKKRSKSRSPWMEIKRAYERIRSSVNWSQISKHRRRRMQTKDYWFKMHGHRRCSCAYFYGRMTVILTKMYASGDGNYKQRD